MSSKKEECTIVGHLGLGDLLLLAPIACYKLREYETVWFPSSTGHMDSVKSFFLLQPNVKVYECSNYPEPYKHCTMHGDIIRTGFYGWDIPDAKLPVDNNISFAENFYRQANVDYSVRWDYSPIPEVVNKFYNASLSNPDVNTKILKKYRIIRPNSVGGSILSYVPFISNAWEIHCIDSSFMHLVESLILNPVIKLFYHRYARPVRKNLYENGRWNDKDVPSRKSWTIY
jgi:hypothetical protein